MDFKNVNILGLFDGIGCGMVSAERSNLRIGKYTSYEIDKDAIKVNTTNHPNIIHKGDVFKFDESDTDYNLLIGGSPCTSWSIACARGNGEGTREITSKGIGWELFSQFVRVLNLVNPEYFIYENNFSMSDAIKDEITKSLGVQPIMIDSAYFSAQIRERYYWTNIPVDLNYIPSDLVFLILSIKLSTEFTVMQHTKKPRDMEVVFISGTQVAKGITRNKIVLEIQISK